jgi:hypothetical protein
LPTGLVRTDGVVTKHPNLEVQQRIDLIFATFFEKKSVSQAVRWFIKNELLLYCEEKRTVILLKTQLIKGDNDAY